MTSDATARVLSARCAGGGRLAVVGVVAGGLAACGQSQPTAVDEAEAEPEVLRALAEEADRLATLAGEDDCAAADEVEVVASRTANAADADEISPAIRAEVDRALDAMEAGLTCEEQDGNEPGGEQGGAG